MSTEKLSELSKPVGFIEQSGMAYLRSGADADIWPDGGRGGDIPLYSQEYVSALKHESAVNWEAAASLNVENQELKKRIAELSRLLSHNIERAEEAEKRLATPVRLPRTLWYEHDELPQEIPVLEKKKVVAEIRAAGFKVEGDE